jgi:serine/threonine protein phosphatase PrpC
MATHSSEAAQRARGGARGLVLAAIVLLALLFAGLVAIVVRSSAASAWTTADVARRFAAAQPRCAAQDALPESGSPQVPERSDPQVGAPESKPPEMQQPLPKSIPTTGIPSSASVPPASSAAGPSGIGGPVQAQVVRVGGETPQVCAQLAGAPLPLDDRSALDEAAQSEGPVERGNVSYESLGGDQVLMVAVAGTGLDGSGPRWLLAGTLAFVGALAAALVALRRPARPTPAPRLHPHPPPLPLTPEHAPARAVDLPRSTSSGVSGLTADRGRCGAFEVYAATQAGLQHARYGETREDAYAIGGEPSSGWAFLAVADGLGSTGNAHAAAVRASRRAVVLLRQAAAEFVSDALSPERWAQIAAELIAGIARSLDPGELAALAAETGFEGARGPRSDKSARAPACTLIVAALRPAAHGAFSVLWAGVGDCELLLVDTRRKSLRWVTQNAAKSRAAITNVTAALPRQPEAVVVGIEHVDAGTLVVLASDGAGDAIRMVPEHYEQLLPTIVSLVPSAREFSEVVDFDLPGLHDDRTLVMAWLRAAGREQRSTQ